MYITFHTCQIGSPPLHACNGLALCETLPFGWKIFTQMSSFIKAFIFVYVLLDSNGMMFYACKYGMSSVSGAVMTVGLISHFAPGPRQARWQASHASVRSGLEHVSSIFQYISWTSVNLRHYYWFTLLEFIFYPSNGQDVPIMSFQIETPYKYSSIFLLSLKPK